MEQAFIRIKLLAGDMSDIQQKIKKLQSDLKIQFDNRQMGDFKNSVKDFVSGISGLNGIGEMWSAIFDKAQKNVELGLSEFDKTQEKITTRKAYASLLGTDNLADVSVLADALEASGARNPYMMLSNFMGKMGEARSGEDPLLKQYTGMDNLTALTTLIEDLQTKGKFSAEDRTQILKEIFGSVYGDNMEKILGQNNFKELLAQQEQLYKQQLGVGSKEEINKVLKGYEERSLVARKGLMRNQQIADIEKEKLILGEETGGDFIKAVSSKQIDKLYQQQKDLEAFVASATLTTITDNLKGALETTKDAIIEGLGTDIELLRNAVKKASSYIGDLVVSGAVSGGIIDNKNREDK